MEFLSKSTSQLLYSYGPSLQEMCTEPTVGSPPYMCCKWMGWAVLPA